MRLDVLLTQAYAETEAPAADAISPGTTRTAATNPLTGKPLQFTTLTLGLLVALNWLAYGLTLLH